MTNSEYSVEAQSRLRNMSWMKLNCIPSPPLPSLTCAIPVDIIFCECEYIPTTNSTYILLDQIHMRFSTPFVRTDRVASANDTGFDGNLHLQTLIKCQIVNRKSAIYLHLIEKKIIQFSRRFLGKINIRLMLWKLFVIYVPVLHWHIKKIIKKKKVKKKIPFIVNSPE